MIVVHQKFITQRYVKIMFQHELVDAKNSIILTRPSGGSSHIFYQSCLKTVIVITCCSKTTPVLKLTCFRFCCRYLSLSVNLRLLY